MPKTLENYEMKFNLLLMGVGTDIKWVQKIVMMVENRKGYITEAQITFMHLNAKKLKIA